MEATQLPSRVEVADYLRRECGEPGKLQRALSVALFPERVGKSADKCRIMYRLSRYIDPVTSATDFCAACNNPVERWMNFCPSCGRRIVSRGESDDS